MAKHVSARRRKWIQALGAVAMNGHLGNFRQGHIATGFGKSVCVPVLNCYSCPGAVGACPIGSLQAVAGSGRLMISQYVLGMMLLFGILGGRIYCGYLCPFGLLQELLYRIPLKKWRVPAGIHRIATKIKYLVLLFPVLLLPAVFQDAFGLCTPYFCAWICPAGTLEAGLPLLATNASLRSALGGMFVWKLILAMVFIFLTIRISRFFCRYLCPLGAFYGLLNPVSWYRLECNSSVCTQCKRCTRVCTMAVDPSETPNSPECIRCQDCVAACPEQALRMRAIKYDGQSVFGNHPSAK